MADGYPTYPTNSEQAIRILKEIGVINAQASHAKLNDRKYLSDVLYQYSQGLNFQSSPDALAEAIKNIETISKLQGDNSYLRISGLSYINRLKEEKKGADALAAFDAKFSDSSGKLKVITKNAKRGEGYNTADAQALLEQMYNNKKDNIKYLDPARRGMWQDLNQEAKDVNEIIGVLDALDTREFDKAIPHETRGVQLDPSYAKMSIKEKTGRVYAQDKVKKAEQYLKLNRFTEALDEVSELLAMPDAKKAMFVKSMRTIHPKIEAAVNNIAASADIKDSYPELKGMGIGNYKDYFLSPSEAILESPETVREAYNLMGDWMHAVIAEESTSFNPLGMLPFEGVGRFLDDHPSRGDMDRWLQVSNEENYFWLIDDALTSGSFQDANVLHAFKQIKEARDIMADAYKEFTGEELGVPIGTPPGGGATIKYVPPPSHYNKPDSTSTD